MERNQFSDITDGAVWLGSGGTLSNVNVDDNTYSLSFAALPGDPIFNAVGDGGSLSNVAFRRNRIQTFVSHTGIFLSQVAGAVVDTTRSPCPRARGRAASVREYARSTAAPGCGILGNTVNGSGNPLAYRFFGVGLTATANSVTDNIFNQCLLDAGGATTSGNTINP